MPLQSFDALTWSYLDTGIHFCFFHPLWRNKLSQQSAFHFARHSLIIFEEQLMFAAEVQGSFCELMIVVRMMMLVCIVVPLLCIWEGFCVAIMAMKMELAAVLVLLLAPVTWFYCHMKIHFQIRTWNIKIYMVLSINFILCMHTFYTITYKCYKLVLEQTYSVLEQLPDC